MFVTIKYFETIYGLVPAKFTLRSGLCYVLLSVLVPCLMSSSATGQIPSYRLDEIPINQGPSGTVQANQMNNLGMVVGFHTVAGVQTGYVYDHYGLIGDPQTVHSLNEWIPALPAPWIASSCVGINNLGQVVGYFSDAQSRRIGYFLDLDVFADDATPSWGLLPTPSASSYGKLINDNQDVLIYSQDMSQGHLCNLGNLASGTFILTDPTSSVPLAFTVSTRVDLNNSGQLVGNTLNSGVFRLTPGVLLEFPPLDNSQCAINDAGLMAGTLPATGSGKRAIPKRACRYGSQIEALSSLESFAHDINNDGDVAGRVGGASALYHDTLDTWLLLDDLVIGSVADLDLWFKTSGKRAINLADRDATGFGQILALVNTTNTTGSGKNKVTTTVTRFFMLTPELLP